MARKRTLQTIENQPPDIPAEAPLVSAEKEAQLKQMLEVVNNVEATAATAGSAEAFHHLETMGKMGKAKAWAKIREEKRYKGTPFTDDQGEYGVIRTWDEFCLYKLRRSRSSVDEAIQNLEKFGEEFLESAASIGLRDHDIRKLRKLPDDVQTVFVNDLVVGIGDRATLEQVFNEQESRHAEVKNDLEKNLEDIKADLKASRQLVADKDEENRQLGEKIIKNDLVPTPWPRIVGEIGIQIEEQANKALEALDMLQILQDQILHGDVGDRSDAEMKPAADAMGFKHLHCATQVFGLAGQVFRDSQDQFEGCVMESDDRAANPPADVSLTIDGDYK